LAVAAVWGANSQRLCFWGIGAENNLLRQFALLDLSILNFSIVLGESGGPSCNRSAKHHSRSYDAVIRVYDDAGNVIQTHEHAGSKSREPLCFRLALTGTRR
jgi:hypothetical protein